MMKKRGFNPDRRCWWSSPSSRHLPGSRGRSPGSFIAKSREASCLNNLRSLGVGLQTYIQEHNNHLPTLEAGRKSKTEDIPVLETALLSYFESPEAFQVPGRQQILRCQRLQLPLELHSKRSARFRTRVFGIKDRPDKSRSSPTRKPGISAR